MAARWQASAHLAMAVPCGLAISEERARRELGDELAEQLATGWIVPRRHSWFTTPTSEKKNFGAAITGRLGRLVYAGSQRPSSVSSRISN